MTELPGTEWRNTPWTVAEALTLAPMQLAPLGLAWRGAGQVRHGFTHFELIIDVLAAQVPQIEAEGFARPLDTLDDTALPSVMRKCVRIASSAISDGESSKADRRNPEQSRVHNQQRSLILRRRFPWTSGPRPGDTPCHRVGDRINLQDEPAWLM
jgi:hypothetical protein